MHRDSEKEKNLLIMEKKLFKIEQKKSEQRLDSFICEIFDEYSRSQAQKQIEAGLILVNKKKQKASYRLKADDIVEIDEQFSLFFEIKPENISLDIRYEDENMLVVNKPKKMLSHPTSSERSQTLVNALIYRYGKEGLSNLNGLNRPGIVHRLDRNTSGLMMVAKNNESHRFLSDQIQKKTAIRKYYAIVEGNISDDSGRIETFFGRSLNHPEKMSVLAEGKIAITNFKVLERFKNHTFVEVSLETGRTHQIRVHFAYIGHKIVNDSLYGAKKMKVKTTEQALMAYSLTFIPLGKNSPLTIEVEKDNDIEKVLRYLRSLK